MNKFIFRPILTTSALTIIISLIYGMYNASLPGGQGGMIGGMAFFISLIAGIILVIENFIIKNSAATNKEMLISELIFLLIGITCIFFIIN